VYGAQELSANTSHPYEVMSADNAWPSEMIEVAAGPFGGDSESSTTIGLEVLLRNGKSCSTYLTQRFF
jgi:hypothetical protein